MVEGPDVSAEYLQADVGNHFTLEAQALAGLRPRRLVEGYDADLVLVDMDSRRVVQDSDTWTRVGWTPFAGRELTGWPMYTIVDGQVVHKRAAGGPLRGTAVAAPGSAGRSLRFS